MRKALSSSSVQSSHSCCGFSACDGFDLPLAAFGAVGGEIAPCPHRPVAQGLGLHVVLCGDLHNRGGYLFAVREGILQVGKGVGECVGHVDPVLPTPGPLALLVVNALAGCPQVIPDGVDGDSGASPETQRDTASAQPELKVVQEHMAVLQEQHLSELMALRERMAGETEQFGKTVEDAGVWERDLHLTAKRPGEMVGNEVLNEPQSY